MTNFTFLSGNVGSDPETATTFNGTIISTFRLATSRPRRVDGKVVKGEDGYTEQETEWHRIKCFKSKAETVRDHCVKGMKVSVTGRIHYTKWTDQQGVERYGTEILADDVQFLTWPKQERGASSRPSDSRTEIDDEIPF